MASEKRQNQFDTLRKFGSSFCNAFNVSDADSMMLPPALSEYKAKLLGGVVLMIIVVIVATALLGEWKTLVFLFIPAYLVYMSALVNKDWQNGVLIEVSAVCSAVRASSVRHCTVVSFCRHDAGSDKDMYYQFTIPNREAADNFIPESTYLLYFRETNRKSLVAFRQI